MFNWALFLLLIAVALPGLLVTVPRLLRMLEPTLAAGLKPGQTLPSRGVLVAASAAQSLVLVAAASAAGTALAPRIGLGAPFFAALADGAWTQAWAALTAQVGSALGLGAAGMVVFLPAYYGVFRPKMDPPSVAVAEQMRGALGLPARILYGGIFEEVLTRWGLMTLLVWLISRATGVTAGAFWLGIVLSGVLFGLGHLPGSFAAGVRRTPWNIATSIFLNLWASLIFGWLFWQVGLLAAMIGHMLFHLIWYPIERRIAPAAAAQPVTQTGASSL